MIRTVISDLGRVLLWFDNDIFIRNLATLCGRSMDDVKAAAHWNRDLILAFDKGLLSRQEFHRRIVDALGAEIGPGEFFEIYNDIFAPIDRPREVLRRVQEAGYRLLLLSNTDVERYGFVRKRFPEVFFFDDYILSFELGTAKPEPGIYREALRRAGCRAEECVFIDDIPVNVVAAVKLGMAGIVFQPETDLAAELLKLGLKF